jgi:arylsulfatase A-like enzyme
MSKIKITLSLILLIVGLLPLLLFKNSGSSKRYNIILIVSDALRADVIGCCGGNAKTPNIDHLAELGVLFERAYSTSPLTMPSAVSMFTGESPDVYRSGTLKGKSLAKYYVPNNDLLLAEVLRGLGYDVRKDIENPLAEMHNNMQGFEKIKPFDRLTKRKKTYVENITGIRPVSKYYKSMYGFLNSILNVSENRPFFLLKWILDPHSPYNPPPKFIQRINLELPKLSRKANFYSNVSMVATQKIKKWPAYDQEYLNNLYIREVEFVDERIGFILATIKHKDLFDSTYVIFTSDHGELFGEHGEWGHGQNFYEDLVHVPLIIAGPGIPKGKRVKTTLVSHLDLMPTLKDLIGVEYQDNGQGKSYSELLSGNLMSFLQFANRNDHYAYFVEGGKRCRFRDGLIDNSHKLIALKGDTYYELYDLADDPNELNDISGENPALVSKMTKKVEKTRKENKRRREAFLMEIHQKEKVEEVNKRVDERILEHLKSLGYIN